jgi:Asp-tRNA(Asn)/Glu-tRNA(Gln) amidotransferase C subunit
MSDAEQEKVLKQAGDCVDGECSLDEVSELLSLLKDTEHELETRLEKIMNMVSHLQDINAKEERKTDEVRAFVKDLLRVFAHDVRQRRPSYFDLFVTMFLNDF